MQRLPKDLESGLRELGVTPEALSRMTALPSPQDVQKALTALQAAAKKRYRELALELHPDRTQGDEAKTERFKAIVLAYKEVQSLRVVVRRPPPPPMPIQVFYGGMTYASTGTTSTTSTSWSSTGWNTIRVKIF